MSPVGIVDASMIMAATTIKQAAIWAKKISTVVSMIDLVDIKDVFNKFLMMTFFERKLEMSDKYFDEMITARRTIHRRPEEGWTEFETMWYVCSHLDQWGIPYLTGTKVINPKFAMGRNEQLVKDAMARALKQGVPQEFLDKTEGYTGAVAVIDTGRPGPVTAFRFDMDALPVRESDAPEHPPVKEGFASERPGLMHACGHDGHTAVGLTVAHWLWDHKEQFCGKFKILFQPAEEGVRGARPMAESGIVDDANWLVGSHIGGNFKPGEICVQTGGFLASTKFDITFIGQEAHAGNAPHKGHSALVAAACATMMIQGIPRHGDGDTRVAVGKLNAGEGRNIVAAHATMQMEVRGSTQEVNDFMAENVEHIIEGVERAYQVKANIERVGESSTLVLCPKIFDVLEEAMHKVPGAKVLPRYSAPAGSEDCSWLIRRVAEHGGQAGFFLFGALNHGHHRPDFDIQDTQTLPIGFNTFIEFAKIVNKA